MIRFDDRVGLIFGFFKLYCFNLGLIFGVIDRRNILEVSTS